LKKQKSVLDKYILIIIFSLVTFQFVFSQNAKTVPPEIKIVNYVTDLSGTLTSQQKISLETKLSDFEKQTSNQVVVYIISSLEGESLEEKSIEIADKNGIGQKGKNNGVLLFIAMTDRKLRIEVGYGLEGALPDALCNQIIRKEITPQFKQGNYYNGVNAGVDAIFSATKGEYTQDKTYTEKRKDTGTGGLCCGFPIFFIVIFIIGFLIIFNIIRRVAGFGRGRGNGCLFLPFMGGSSWSNSSSSSFSGFSGFSGGGGSFGGGGSSGSW
jgi:uncharacterized protein